MALRTNGLQESPPPVQATAKATDLPPKPPSRTEPMVNTVSVERLTYPSVERLTNALEGLDIALYENRIGKIEAKLPVNSLVIPAELVKKIRSEFEPTQQKRFLPTLATLAKKYAQCPVTKHAVGVAAIGKSGTIYLAYNVEFENCSPNSYINAIHFLILTLGSYEETGISELALSDDLLGPELGLLNELSWPINCKVHISEKEPVLMTALLKEARPSERLELSRMIKVQTVPNETSEEDYPLGVAQAAARHSYSPLTNTESGVALRTSNGNIYPGSYIETHAYTCLGPLQMAFALFLLIEIPMSRL